VDLILYAARRGDPLQLPAQPVRGRAGDGVALRAADQQQLYPWAVRCDGGHRGDEPVKRLLRMQEPEEHHQGGVRWHAQLASHVRPDLGSIAGRGLDVQADRHFERGRATAGEAGSHHVQLLR
jgi:hypothetical protein